MTALTKVCLTVALWMAAPFAAHAYEEHFLMEGAGGVPLAVSVMGNLEGPEVLLLHGLGHGRASFAPQLKSDLAEDFKLVTFDLRGHGQSGKPWTKRAYEKPSVWADDVIAVIERTKLRRPVIVGWSYGGLVAADVLRERSRARIAGVMLVSSLAGMVDYTPDYAAGGEEMAEAYRLLGQPNVKNQAKAIAIIEPFLFAKEPSAAWRENARQLGMMLPPYVRPLLFAHQSDNNDLIATLKLPVMVLHGSEDAAIPQTAVDAFVAAAPNATAYRFDDLGHSSFAEDPAAFNAQLRSFVETVWEPSP